MPKQTVVQSTSIMGKGAVFEVSSDGGTVYNTLPGLDEIPKIGSEGSFVRIDDIDELTERYGKGLLQQQDVEIACKRIGDDVVQDTLIGVSNDPDDNTTYKLRVTYRTGDVCDIDCVFNGFYMESVENGEGHQMFAVKGKLSGALVMSKVA